MLRSILIVVVVLVSPGRALGDDRTLNQAATLFDSVMSPYCPGRTLSACPSDDARALREEITQSLESGATIDQAKARLVERFGPDVLGVPAEAPLRLASWSIPALFLGLGLVVIRVFVRRNRTVALATPVVTPEMRARIEAELAARAAQSEDGDA